MIKQLEDEIQTLKNGGMESEVKEADGLIYIIIESFPLPRGYNKPCTRVLLKIPLSYPNGNPDMFWTDPDLRLISGASQANTNIEAIFGKPWLRFSWHPKKWNPGIDNINTFIEFVNRRLVQLK
jgi:hypothetical protein